MFERFTETARQVVILAQQEARELGHPHIGTEHLLIALAKVGDDDPLMRSVCESQQLDAGVLRATVRELVPSGENETTLQIPFTPHAKSAFERSLRACMALGSSRIVPAHILLGLLDTGDSKAIEVLKRQGLDPGELRATVENAVLAHPEATSLPPPDSVPGEGNQPDGLILLLRHILRTLAEDRPDPAQLEDLHSRLAPVYAQWLRDTGREPE